MKFDVVWGEIEKLPQFLPVPKSGQSIDDDECEHVALEMATIGDIETILAEEPDFIGGPDWYTPNAIMVLKWVMEWAKAEKVSPADGVFLALRLIQKH